MALGCLQDDATTTNDNSNRRRHQILSACGGFLFSRKSVARGVIHPFFCQNTQFPPKSNKTAPAAKPLSACHSSKDLKCVVRRRRRRRRPSPVPIKFPAKYIIEFLLYIIT